MHIRIFLVFMTWIAIQGHCSGQNITGKATCDNSMFFYADGVLKAESDDWTVASDVSIPNDTTVVAVKCIDKGVIAGIKVFLSNGIKTNSSWKCSTQLENNWNKPGFDDSHWSHAVEHTAPQWGNKPQSLNGKASWIWTQNFQDGDMLVYCRKKIGSGHCSTRRKAKQNDHMKRNDNI